MMTIAQTQEKIYTTDEYLELETAAETRHEYQNGEIIEMAGGTPQHNRISGNLYIALSLALKAKPYETCHADQRLWIPAANLYTYPDVMVASKPLELLTGRKDTVVNPCFVGEVLSASTQNYDRGEKFAAYRTIPSVREYLLINQYRFQVEHYLKTAANQWLLTEYTDPNINLSLNSFDLQIKIADFYENIDFEEV